ncbi:hypothetical protein M1D52_22080 [Olivibacter sp. SA151]|uniref:hypothetical protein n=1 Tax=Olivibacter jilunii TaxID=985016 RepID=UPI003F169B9C
MEIKASSFGITGNGADETTKVIDLFNNMPNNAIVDFEGMIVTVYVGVSGSSTGDALPLQNIIRIFDKHHLIIKNGTLKAANPGVSPQKLRYPSTLSIDYCHNLSFENFNFYGRGESFGDSDASAALSFEQRRYFIQQNGGAAVTVVKSKEINFYNCNAYLCGSVGTFYISSSDKIKLTNCYANPASLGYAAYCHDAWAGPNYDNKNVFESFFYNCAAYLTSVTGGSSTYCAKCGVLGEDGGVNIQVIGGTWRDFYANGSDRYLGFAFGATSCKITVSNATVDLCDAVLFSGNTSNNPSIVNASGLVCTRIGRTVVEIDNSSFSSSEVNVTDSVISIVGGRTWPDGPLEQRVTSVVANRKVASLVNVTISSCRIIGASLLAINSMAVYGMLKTTNSFFSLSNKILDSKGWGSSSATVPSNRNQGIIIDSDFNVTSTSDTAPLISWTVPSPQNVYVRTQIDLTGSSISSISSINRNLLDSTALTLVDTLTPPRLLIGAYYRCTNFFQQGMVTMQYVAFMGLANDLTIARFKLPSNIIPMRLVGVLQKIVGGSVTSWSVVALKELVVNDRSTEVDIYIKGTNIPQLTQGDTYKFLELT